MWVRDPTMDHFFCFFIKFINGLWRRPSRLWREGCFLLKLGNNYHRLQQTATNCHMTLCEVLWWNHSRSVTKNLTPYRFNSAGWGLDGQNAEIHSFPTMYNTWGCLLGRNGSKQWFSPKKWSKNSFFEYHDSGSSNFGLGWDPKF